MSALAKLWRATAFRITLVNLAIFILFAFVAFGYVAWSARRVVDTEIAGVIEAEIRGLADQYNQGGLPRLVSAVGQRSAQPGASLYLVTNVGGRRLAGNIAALQPGVLDQPGVFETAYQATEEADRPRGRAIIRVFVIPGGVRVVVGRDVAERDRLGAATARAFGWSLALVALLGGAAGLFVTRRVLKRVDSMTATAQRIMGGQVGDRLPVTGSGDEFDRLATNLNAMLDRIGDLMAGIQQVSDNIAHDLKTPLTRLRNRAEGALRAGSPEDHRRALEACIEESDNLIRVFNALLTIARLESGEAKGAFAPFDAADALRDMAELYDPIAEEAGADLAIDAPPALPLRASRELVGQALANLVENAIKYGAAEGRPHRIAVAAHALAGGGVEFAVSDRGPGIPEADRERVVKRFERLESARTKGGFGLGLSLVAAVAKLHRGRLALEDNGPGLRVRLAIPDAPAA